MEQEHVLIVVNGPPGVGKTFFMLWLLAHHAGLVSAVRGVTTRPQREPNESLFFDFLSEQSFYERMIGGNVLLSGVYRDSNYGIYPDHTRNVLASSHGIMALTIRGIDTYRDHCPDIGERLRVVALRPATPTVLLKNLLARNTPEKEIEQELARGAAHAYPNRPNVELTMYGADNDLPALAEELFRQLGIS